ncbi:nucleoside hydrolase [Leifsonia sp. 2MCAF36]|uniref:nucleoside hydrolase n=1 Tax=Leifsonia sp. 2MCAF36 TaxID=3232988 RepID=UPI003F9DD323
MKRRLIIDTDAKNEADDQFAIVHALLSPSITVEGIIAAHFGEHRTLRSLEESREEIDMILSLLHLADDVIVVNGAERAMIDAATPQDSEGARFIVEEARRPGPLFVIFLGPLTDMASALLLDPTIADNSELTVVWIGGTPYDDIVGAEHGEFNLSNDIAAANLVFRSRLRVWQIPMNVYRMVSVGYAELEEKVAPHGELGSYLVRQLKEFNAEHEDPEIEYRSLGDSPAVSVVLNPLGAVWRDRPARVFDEQARMTNVAVEGKSVRVADHVDVRFLLEDMFAKIKAHAEAGSRPGSVGRR